MKKAVIILWVVLLFSCEEEVEPVNQTHSNTSIQQVRDDFQLLAVSQSGGVYEIGNNSGKVKKTGQMKVEVDGSILWITNMCSVGSRIYAIENISRKPPNINLLVYDVKSNTSEIVPILLPSSIPASEPGAFIPGLDGDGIVVMTPDDRGNLTALLIKELLFDEETAYLLSIDTQDYQVTDMRIRFKQDTVVSMLHIERDKLLLSSNDGFWIVNRSQRSVNKLTFKGSPLKGGSNMVKINNTKVALMQALPSGYQIPMELDLAQEALFDKSNGKSFVLDTRGKALFQSGQYISLATSVTSNTSSPDYFAGILKFNYTTGEIKTVHVQSDWTGTLVGIKRE